MTCYFCLDVRKIAITPPVTLLERVARITEGEFSVYSTAGSGSVEITRPREAKEPSGGIAFHSTKSLVWIGEAVPDRKNQIAGSPRAMTRVARTLACEAKRNVMALVKFAT